MRVTRGLPLAWDVPAALTIGNFDGVHVGHQAMLARLKHAATERNLATGVLTFEPHPREFFAPDQAPVRLTSLREKIELVAAHGIDRLHVCDSTMRCADDCTGTIERIMSGITLGARIGDDSVLERAAPGNGRHAQAAAAPGPGGGDRA